MNEELTETSMGGTKKIDAVASELGKELGIAHAEAGSGPDWQATALAKIKEIAAAHAYLIADDLWAAGLVEPGESRALGAAMRNAKTAGFIEPTSTFVSTHQETRHHAPVRVWKSKLCGGGDQLFFESDLLSRKLGAATVAGS
jgi:hypothetical protein